MISAVSFIFENIIRGNYMNNVVAYTKNNTSMVLLLVKQRFE